MQGLMNWKNTRHTGRSASQVIAASGASALSRVQADRKGSGSADDVQIQAAITAISATGGVVKWIGPNFYTSATINLVSSVTLSMEGITIRPQAETFAAFTGSNDSNFKLGGPFIITYGDATGGVASTNPLAIGISLSGGVDSEHFEIDDCVIQHAYRGIYTTGIVWNYIVNNLQVQDCGNYGVYLDAGVGVTITFNNLMLLRCGGGFYANEKQQIVINNAGITSNSGTYPMLIQSGSAVLNGINFEGNDPDTLKAVLLISNAYVTMNGGQFNANTCQNSCWLVSVNTNSFVTLVDTVTVGPNTYAGFLSGIFKIDSTSRVHLVNTKLDDTTEINPYSGPLTGTNTPALNGGAVNTGVTAIENNDGNTFVTTLTVSKTDALTVADNAALADGYLLYTFPAGAIIVESSYMSMAVTLAEDTTATPDVGLGTVEANGAVATLDGTATFENIITGQTAANCSGTATVKTALPTAGVPFIIEAGDAHTIYFNVADTWADTAGVDLTGDIAGTVVLVWRFMA